MYTLNLESIWSIINIHFPRTLRSRFWTSGNIDCRKLEWMWWLLDMMMKHPGEVIQSFLLLLSLIYDEYWNWLYILLYWGWGGGGGGGGIMPLFYQLVMYRLLQSTVLEFVTRTRSVGELGMDAKERVTHIHVCVYVCVYVCVCDDDDDDDDDSRIGASRTSIYKEVWLRAQVDPCRTRQASVTSTCTSCRTWQFKSFW